MRWSDIPFQPKSRTLRQFAACWLVVFFLLGLVQYHLKHRPQLGLILIGAALLLGIPGLLRPGLVRPIFVSWMVLAFPIGWGLSQTMLLVMFYAILTPVALLFRMRGRDPLRRRRSICASYWVRKETPKDVRAYFRQY